MSRPAHHLYLTGFRGTGKTSVGKWLAEQLARPVIDLDDCIEAAANLSIREIFELEGEVGFRNRETAALKLVTDEVPSVVSLGGGAILRAENRQMITASGYCVWLKADADTIWQRLAEDQTTAARRPSLTSLPPREEIEALLSARESWYASVSNAAVEVAGKSVAAIGKEILDAGKF
jgi:shikimate kinase